MREKQVPLPLTVRLGYFWKIPKAGFQPPWLQKKILGWWRHTPSPTPGLLYICSPGLPLFLLLLNSRMSISSVPLELGRKNLTPLDFSLSRQMSKDESLKEQVVNLTVG